MKHLSRLIRVLLLAQGVTSAFFTYFLVEQFVNDQYFDAWLISNNLQTGLVFGLIALGNLTLISVATATIKLGRVGVFAGSSANGATGRVERPATARAVDLNAAPLQQGNNRTSAPGPSIGAASGPGDTTIVIPKESPLNAWVGERTDQYVLVDRTRKAPANLPALPAKGDSEDPGPYSDNRGS